MSERKKRVRAAFRKAVFDRDGGACRKCGSKEGLDAHHITDRNEMPNGGYVPENRISLCGACHRKAELWHSSKGDAHVVGYKPDDLYAIIGSSLESASASANGLGEAAQGK